MSIDSRVETALTAAIKDLAPGQMTEIVTTGSVDPLARIYLRSAGTSAVLGMDGEMRRSAGCRDD